MTKNGPLHGIKIVDLTDEKSIYGAKLLADLGAAVVRPEPPEGDPLRRRGPHHEGSSLWHAFFASSRRFVTIDLPKSLPLFQALLGKADVILTGSDGFGLRHADLAGLQDRRPELIVIDALSFHRSGPWKDFLAPDLVAGALAGAVGTTGDVDTPPLKTFGELNFMVSGAYVAIAALAALHARHKDGLGQRVDVSVHESIASCLEQVLMFYWYSDALGRPEDKVLPRRGSKHWSDAYEVFPTRDGAMMVTPTPDFDRQLAWLVEEGVHDDLLDPKYEDIANARARVHRTMAIMRQWVAGKDSAALFAEAQARHSPYGWVLPMSRLADNEQLTARNWYQDYVIDGRVIKSPGAPFHFSETPWRLTAYSSEVPSLVDVIADIGWESRHD